VRTTYSRFRRCQRPRCSWLALRLLTSRSLHSSGRARARASARFARGREGTWTCLHRCDNGRTGAIRSLPRGQASASDHSSPRMIFGARRPTRARAAQGSLCVRTPNRAGIVPVPASSPLPGQPRYPSPPPPRYPSPPPPRRQARRPHAAGRRGSTISQTSSQRRPRFACWASPPGGRGEARCAGATCSCWRSSTRSPASA
jgi:hypothetical protein